MNLPSSVTTTAHQQEVLSRSQHAVVISELESGTILYANEAATRILGQLSSAPQRLADFIDWDPQPTFDTMSRGGLHRCDSDCHLRTTGEPLKLRTQLIQHGGASPVSLTFLHRQHGYETAPAGFSRYSRVILIGAADEFLVITDATLPLHSDGPLRTRSILGTSLIDWVSQGQVDRLESWAEAAVALPAHQTHAIFVNLAPPWHNRRAMVVARPVAGAGFLFTALGLEAATGFEASISAHAQRDPLISEDSAPTAHRQDTSGLARRLAPREWEVITELVNGYRVPSIARRLFLSAGTVRNHLSSAYRKLGVKGQQELLDLFRNTYHEGGGAS